MTAKRTLLENWYDDVWTGGNLDAVGKYFAPDAEAEGILPGMAADQDDMKELVSMVRPLLNDMKVTVLHTIEQDDWLSALLVVKGVASRNGGPVRVFSQVMIRVKDNKICEAYYGLDALTLFEQLGQLPPNTMPQLLGGTFMR